MLFRRRESESWWERLRVHLWPRRSWSRSGRYVVYRLRRLGATPHAIALGFAIGAFAAVTPYIGTHLMMAALLSWAIGGSIVASVLGTFVGNPLTYPLLWYASYEVGNVLLGGASSKKGDIDLSQGLFQSSFDQLWPILTPEALLAELYMSPERLRAAGADLALWRADGDAWTVSDVPLLDELVDLLGRDKPADDTSERERRAEAEYAAGVLDLMISREDLMDDEDHLLAQDMLYAEDLADRFVERDTRELVERAAADRDWTYGHVVVDEAQELSEMDWRVLMRRCPSRSFTVVGDLAQRRSVAGATSWDTMLEPYVAAHASKNSVPRWDYRSLSVNYRTPAEIMAVAAALLAEFAPEVQPPESVRACGVQPWSRQVTGDELAAAMEEFVRDEAAREGTSVVIGPPGVPGAVVASEAKGLEFDAVLVVEPERILTDGPRGAAELYVALTRATQRLGVLHQDPLPQALTGLSRRNGDLAALTVAERP